MSSEELYFNFHLILNKNASQRNTEIPRAYFVSLYNREALNWLQDYIEKNSSTQKIHNVQGLLTTNYKLNEVRKYEQYDVYSLPLRYFEFVGSRSLAKKGKCQRWINNYLPSPKNINVQLDDETPSFEYEESVCNITENKLVVYKDKYEINDTYLSYYMTPTKIDLSGYENLNTGENSKTVDSDLDERYQNEIIDRVVLEVMREFENPNGFKLSQERIQTN